MNRLGIGIRVATIFIVLMGGLALSVNAQEGKMAPKLPEGMKGSNPNDPRAKLKPGLYDAGEAAFGMRHVALLKKPDVFQLGTSDANSERVKKTLGSLGVPENAPIPAPAKLVYAQLAFANSDIAFQGDRLFQGNFYGVNIFDIANPEKAKLLTSIVCPGGQGDVSVYKNLLFMSVEMPNGRTDCGDQGFPANSAETQGQLPAASKDRFRGLRIFDISDLSNPKQVATVQSCRGSHTHTLVTDPNNKNEIYVYISGTSFVRQSDELSGCSDGEPDKDPNTARFRIDIVKVPLATPQDSKIVASPRIFSDPNSGKINALNNGGSHEGQVVGGVVRAEDTDQCHDITAYPEIGLAAGACAGNGILLDIRKPEDPKRIDSVNDKNYAYWHSASFSNDGKKVLYTDEWGGGMGARCRETDPSVWGADAIFSLDGKKLKFDSYYKLPAAQSETENCVAHNGSLIPVPGRDLKVQAWYQGGVSIVDFTDPMNPFEVAYFDRGSISPDMLVLAGSWSAYWYNGKIYSSEIARGLDILELTPTKLLSKNEIAAAKSVYQPDLNVQMQTKFGWTNNMAVANAYLDQLERSAAIAPAQLLKARGEIAMAEKTKNGKKLSGLVPSLQKSAKSAKNPADKARFEALATIMRSPAF